MGVLSIPYGLQALLLLYSSIILFLTISDLSLEYIRLWIDSFYAPAPSYMHMNLTPVSFPIERYPDIDIYNIETTVVDTIEQFSSRGAGVRKIFNIYDPLLLENPQFLADAYRSEGPGA